MKRTTILLLMALVMGAFTACQSATTPASEPRVPGLFEIALQLSARRHENIDRLIAYRQDGVYPRNRVQPGLANVFIDDDGHLCAVANLMSLDGETDLVAQTARDHNLVVLRNVDDGPLYDWVLASGLTQEEIDRIQEPYIFEDPEDPNFVQVEDQRLDNHFVQVEQELRQSDARSILLAARRQREATIAAYDAE